MSTSAQYDVFLSHNSADKPEVETIGDRLRQERFNPFLDKWHLVPGKPWQTELTVALDASACVAIFFGPNGDGPWHNEEMQLALLKAVRTNDDHRLIPVLLPGADPSQIDGFLELRTWVDFRPGLDDEAAFQRLVAAIKGVAPDSAEGLLELPDEPRPYRGIERFEGEQQQFFFGRDDEIRRLIERLEQERFVAVVGASGSGKSSLARAGFYTDAAEQTQPGIRDWRRIVLMPKSNPLLELAANLVAHLPVVERPALVKTFIDDFRNSPDGLITALTTLFPNPDQPVLLLVDQFEELFTQRPPAEQDQTEWRQRTACFAENLLTAVNHKLDWLRIVVTLRADFLDSFVGGDFPDFLTLLERRQFWLGAMGEDDFREVIVRPATQRGAFFEKGLVERILAEMHGEASALPLLEEALGALWDQRRGPWLTHQAYDDIGGVGGALADKADRIFNNLKPSDQKIARRVFLGLIQLGEGTRDTRRRTVVASLMGFADEPERVEEVVRRFSAPGVRLITLSAHPDGGDMAEVTHEALFEHWRQLDEWLDSSRDDLRFQRRLDQAARHWKDQSQATGVLWRPPDLELLNQYHERRGDDMTPLQVDFLLASRRAEQQRIAQKEQQQKTLQRRLRIAVGSAIAAGVLFTIALGLGIAANTQRSKAIAAKHDADAKRTEAVNARQAESKALEVANRERIQAEESARIANQQRNLAMDSIGTLIEDVQEQLTDASTHQLKEQLLNTAMQGLEKLSKNLQTERSSDADADLLMAKARMRLGGTYQLLGKGASARGEFQAAQSILAGLPEEDQTVEARETRIAVLHSLGEVSGRREALVFYKQAMAVADQEPRSGHATRAKCMARLGKGQFENAMIDQAIVTTRQGLDLLEGAGDDN